MKQRILLKNFDLIYPLKQNASLRRLRRLFSFQLGFSLLFLCLGSLAYSQNPDEVDPMPLKIKGLVLNIDDETPVPYAFVMNYRTRTGVTTDDQGKFVMDVLNIDSLSITSLGFTKTTVRIPPNHNEMNVLTLYARPVRFAIPEVNVSGEKVKVNMDGITITKKVDIDPYLRGDSYNEKPPVIAAVLAPVSFIQYYTSKREREKREARQAIVTEKQWEILSQFYTKALVMELTGLNDEDSDELMMYINSKGLLSYMSNEYSVRSTILEQYKLFKAEGH